MSQPRFSRSTLTMLMLFSVLLIVILQRPRTSPPPLVSTPDLPTFQISQWSLANGVAVSFLPMEENHPTQLGWVWTRQQLPDSKLVELTGRLIVKETGLVIAQANLVDRILWHTELPEEDDALRQQIQRLKSRLKHPKFLQTAQFAGYSRADIQNTWRQQFKGRALKLVIMGSISEQEARILAEVVAGELSPGNSPKPLNLQFQPLTASVWPIQTLNDWFLLQFLQLANQITPKYKSLHGWWAQLDPANIALPKWNTQELDAIKRRLASRWLNQLRDPKKRFWWLLSTRGQSQGESITSAFRQWFNNLNAKNLEAQIQLYQTRWQKQ